MSASPLNDIVALLGQADALSPTAQVEVLEQIHGVRRAMDDAPSELLGCLDAAATLVASLPHLELRAATEVREMVARLVDLVAASQREAQAAAARQAEPVVPEVADQARLRAHPLSPTPISPTPVVPTPAPTPPPVAPPPVDLADEQAKETLELEAADDATELDELDGLDDLVELTDIADLDAFEELEELASSPSIPMQEHAPAFAPPPPPAPAPPPRPPGKAGVDYSVPKLNDMMLGEVMIQLGFVSKGEVDTALRRMADYGQRFGEALIEIGAATADDVAQGISLQRLLSQGAQQAQESKFERANVLHGILLGEILVLMGRITRDQLKAGLEHQSHTGSRIGEALVELRFITWNDLDEAISIQHARGGSSELNESSTVVELE